MAEGEISDEEMFGQGKPQEAVSGDEVAQSVFHQSDAGTFLAAAQGILTRPIQAGVAAVENAMTEPGQVGLSDESIKTLQDAGVFNNYVKGHFGFMQAVMQGVLQPAAFTADVALRDINAAATGAVAVGAGIVNEAKGALGLGRASPDTVAMQAQDFTNFLYITAGMSPTGVPVKGNGPSLKEVLSMPAKEGETKVMAEAAVAPAIKAPIENPLIEKESGNLNLKYINASQNVKDILAKSAQAIADRDGIVISNAQTEAQGKAMLEKAMQETEDGIPPELANRMRGDPTNAAELYAARALVAQSGEEYFRLQKIAAQTGDPRDYAALEEGYDRLLTLNGIRHDISATLGRATQSHQIMIGGEEAAQEIVGMTKEDAMRTAMTLPNEQAVAKSLQTMKKPDWSDMAIFHYVSWLLSNPVTHAAYAAFGEVQTALRAGIEQSLSVGIGALQRTFGNGLSAEEWRGLQTERESIESQLALADSGKVKMAASDSGVLEMRLEEIKKKQAMGETRMPAELAGRFYGVGKGQVDGLRAAVRAMKTGSAQMFPGEEAAAREAMKKAEDAALEEGKSVTEARQAGEAEYRRNAISASNPIMERAQYIKNPLFRNLASGYGRIVGVFPTVANAIHTFQKFSGYTESLYAQVYRRAALMGETDEAGMGARIASLLNNPTEEMMQQAAEDGKYASLINKPGIHGQNLEKFAHTSAWTRFVVPFARIATNLTAQSLLERTPVGLFSSEVRARLSGARGAVAQSDAMARMAVGTSIVTAGAWLASNKLVNGIGPSKPADRAAERVRGRPELSVRLGDHFVPLRLLGLPGRIISYGAAAYDVYQGYHEDDDAWDATGHMITTVADTALQENALKGLADFLDAVVGHDAEMSKRYALNAVATVIVPRGVAQMTRLDDPYMRSTMGDGFMERLQKTVDAQLPWKSQELYPQVDVYGRDMLRSYNPEEAVKDPVSQAEDAAHFYPSKVEPRINNVKLTDAQYYQYQKTAGALYYAGMRDIVNNPGFSDLPPETRADMFHNIMTNARASARQQMLLNAPELSAKIAEYTQRLVERRAGIE